MFVKPGTRQDDRDRQLVVRGPNGAVLSVLGGTVPDTQFWFRRLRDGDVVDAAPIPMATEVVRVGSDGQIVEPVSEKIGPRSGPMCREASAALGELVADGTPHEAVFTGDHPAEPALNSHEEHQETGITS